MLVGIDVEHPVAYTHYKNGLAESLIKRLQLIAYPLLMKTKLPFFFWGGHTILHVASLIHIRPTAYHKHSPMQFVCGQQLSKKHLIVMYMFPLHLHNALKWVINVNLEFMLVLILHLLLDILNL